MHAFALSIILSLALLVVANPFGWWMPTTFQSIAAGAVAFILAVFAGMVYRDGAKDERELILRAEAARIGYLAGIAVLGAAVVVPLLTNDEVSRWALGALVAMIIARLLARHRAE